MALKISIMALDESQNRKKTVFSSITPKLLTILNYPKKEKALLAFFTWYLKFSSHFNIFEGVMALKILIMALEKSLNRQKKSNFCQ